MNKRSLAYLVAGLSYGGIVAFAMVFLVGFKFQSDARLTSAFALWGFGLFWPTILALLVRWLGNEKWRHSSTKAFFWLSLFMSPIVCVGMFT